MKKSEFDEIFKIVLDRSLKNCKMKLKNFQVQIHQRL